MIWLALVTLVLTYYLVRRWTSNYPPGPVGLPLVGYLPFLDQDLYLQFIELGKKYGDVFSLQLGTQFVVVLNTESVIKEAFLKPEFLGRPPHNAFSILKRESPFFVSGNDVWNENRKFIIQSMKDFGLGKSKLEDQIQDEINHFLDILRSYEGNPADISIPLVPSVSNNVCSLVFGERYEYDDPERTRLLANLNLGSRILAEAYPVTYFPWLRHFPFIHKFRNIEAGRKAMKDSTSIIRKKIQQHDETLDPKNIRDYIDSYLVEMRARKERDPNTTLSEERLAGSVADLFGAGSVTVRISVLWLVYTVAAFPEVQRRVQEEIEEHIGHERSPQYSDLRQMPFTQAVLMETMRWKTNVPIPFYRYTTDDATLRGYSIPKGSIVLANLWNVHHDPVLWKDPDVFRPERFLSEDGCTVHKSPHFIPFSYGKRGCPGEQLANMEVFLYFASILQAFNISFPEGFQPTFAAKVTLFLFLDPFKVILTRRGATPQ